MLWVKNTAVGRTRLLFQTRTSAHLRQPQVRCWYHYQVRDVYGYRKTRLTTQLSEYTNQELSNRVTHANLVQFVDSYRTLGHTIAQVDPLASSSPKNTLPAELTPERYGLVPGSTLYPLAGILHIPSPSRDSKGKSEDHHLENAPLDAIIEHLQKTYSSHLGLEFNYIPNAVERRWFAKMVESKASAPDRPRYHELLIRSEIFDSFMAKKFPHVKRYGLQGAENMLVMLDTLFKESAHSTTIQDIVLGMPHRGRLNLLTQLLHFPSAALFHKVRGNSEFPPDFSGTGDVLSHLAMSTDLKYAENKSLHVSMLHNPSHLEAINPVAAGKARARQQHLLKNAKQDVESEDCQLGDRVLCLQIHGDAAFAGQGVVTETLGLSNLPHYTCGGSIHVIVNNQIGYTTAAMNARSSSYSSDVAKMIDCPVIHVNGDHPEDVAHATSMALAYRSAFKKDIVLDLIAYRRLGHNELDEPAYTQPVMYKNIRARKSAPQLYEESLVANGTLSHDSCLSLREKVNQELEQALQDSLTYVPPHESFHGKWSGFTASRPLPEPALVTGVDINALKQVGLASVETGGKIQPHERLEKFHINGRKAKIAEGTGLDWATAEAMAFGTLLLEGNHVRISGQDVGRGTFSQRHAMMVDYETERTIIPLNSISSNQGNFEVANSSLSEFAVLGFEYGMSIDSPNRLCIWEAQFGDFFNGAQIVIDTFVSSSEAKWLRQTGMVMLLPHGFDGAGPEHSSCRIERFLQLSDSKYEVLDDSVLENPNMFVVYPTTPAQYFHLLRRQMLLPFRKPMIVVGPKILLRHPVATSSLADMGPGTHFHPVLIESPAIIPPEGVKRVAFCSGKLYYELSQERDEKKRSDVTFIRIEELSPFPASSLRDAIAYYPNATEYYWIQEEPQNQGCFTFVEPRLSQLLPSGHKLAYHGRRTCPTVATGISKWHKQEQEYVVKGFFHK